MQVGADEGKGGKKNQGTRLPLVPHREQGGQKSRWIRYNVLDKID